MLGSVLDGPILVGPLSSRRFLVVGVALCLLAARSPISLNLGPVFLLKSNEPYATCGLGDSKGLGSSAVIHL